MPKSNTEFNKDDHQADVLELHRKVLDGVTLEDLQAFEDSLDPEERREFLEYCAKVVDSPWFAKVFTNLYFPQIMAAATKAANYDEVTFHRATANGISLVQEFFRKRFISYQEEFEQKGDQSGFAQDKPFEETDADQFFGV